jgi:hypothetical protein
MAHLSKTVREYNTLQRKHFKELQRKPYEGGLDAINEKTSHSL